MALKFGSKAWRAKYLKKGKRKNKPKRAAKRKSTKKKRTGPNTYTKRGAAAKRKRMKEMIRSNPPRKWTKVKSVRVVRKNGRDILEIRK